MEEKYNSYEEYKANHDREIKQIKQIETGNKIIIVIILVILTIAMIRFVVNPNAPDYTFTNFIQDMVELGNNQVNIVQLGSFSISGSGIIVDIINYILALINVGVWWSQSILNIILIILKILQICIGI